MAILHTQLNPRSAEFATNSAAMLKQVDALHTLLAPGRHKVAARRRKNATSAGQAAASRAHQPLARSGLRRFWKSASWRPTRCTAKTFPPLA